METGNEESLQLVPVTEEEYYDEDDDERSEDEDEYERNVNQLEREMLEFRDEPRITHNVVPETDDDEEDEYCEVEDEEGETPEDDCREDERRSSHRQRNRENFSCPDGSLSEEMVFFNAAGFKEAIAKYVIKNGYNLRQYRYDKTKCAFKCLGGRGCTWRIYCSRTGRKDEWRIRVYEKEHSCSPNGKCHMMKVPVIARLFLDRVRDEPDYFMPAEMEEMIKANWKVRVSRHHCQAARKKAMRWIEKEFDDQFARLRDYGAEILHGNPNSTVEIETVRNEAGQDVFRRFYVCFEQLSRTWKNTCRRLIGIDGCFLRGKMKGELLVALGRGGNNQIYLIAWGCVQVENTDNWLWFIKKIKVDLELEDGHRYIIISDRQKGLIKVVQLEIPLAEHRMYVRHVYANLKNKHGKKPYMKPLVWSLAWSYNEAEYARRLDCILKYDSQVYADILKTNPTTWCRAFYKLGNWCEYVENNSVEPFNASVVKAREKQTCGAPSQRRIMHCKTCGAPGHNSRFHKSSEGESSQNQIVLVESSQGQSSQPESSQVQPSQSSQFSLHNVD